MQDCWDHDRNPVVGHMTVRWCPDHHCWIVGAWAKSDGDAPFVEVHPMWLHPRTLPDDGYATGTLTQLLSALRSTVQRLASESESGQQPLF